MARDGHLKSKNTNLLIRHDAKVIELITMFGTIRGQQALVLKDNGCNTNLVSKIFLDPTRYLFKTQKSPFMIQHSNRNTVEETSEMLISSEVQIGYHI